MGARKRAARRDSRLTFDRQTFYLAERAKYRIGERLRPCRGCPDCRADPFFRATANDSVCDFCGAFEDTFLEWDAEAFNRDPSATPGNGLHYEICPWLLYRCDGSGVLPARSDCSRKRGH